MEPYRHALYRYSTGEGFNVNVDVPKDANDVASYKMEPLLTRLSGPDRGVDIKREADRVSMQVEAGMQQVKVLGYDSKVGKNLKILKSRVELIRHLMATYPIRYVKRKDLDKLYDLYAKNAPGMDKMISDIVDQNKGATGLEDFIGTAMRVRKGYPLYDKFGRKLTKTDKVKFENLSKKAKGLSGFGAAQETSLLKIVAIGLVAAAVWKMVSTSS
jgi:hypothetical protein